MLGFKVGDLQPNASVPPNKLCLVWPGYRDSKSHGASCK